MLKRFDDVLEKVERALIIALFSALIVLMTVNIIQRNVLGQSSQEILEYLPTMVMWISLIGASLALKDGKHISMELVLRFVPQNAKDILHRFAAAFGCVVMLVLLYLSKDFMAGELKIFGPKGYISSIIPIFFATAAFRYFILILYPLHQNK
ncbi:TRAP transporter small permease [Oligoflexus tunisiensis]|uniref:TRAP transporter small permease n=1 Tax=Oligoflexus tunisiensis TaxID=708132 RepID=UPI00114C8BF9|nr:TRAP transporter small permease [Oligoflexus tunisiensis]